MRTQMSRTYRGCMSYMHFPRFSTTLYVTRYYVRHVLHFTAVAQAALNTKQVITSASVSQAHLYGDVIVSCPAPPAPLLVRHESLVVQYVLALDALAVHRRQSLLHLLLERRRLDVERRVADVDH